MSAPDNVVDLIRLHEKYPGHVLILDDALSTKALPIDMAVSQKITNGSKLILMCEREEEQYTVLKSRVRCPIGTHYPFINKKVKRAEQEQEVGTDGHLQDPGLGEP